MSKNRPSTDRQTAAEETGQEPGSLRTSRRALITGLAVGATGLVADAILTAAPAGADPTPTPPVILGEPNASTSVTEISNTNSGTATAALQVDDIGGGTGPAIVALLTNADNVSPAVQASTAGTGAAVAASTAAAGAAIQATTTGTGAAVAASTAAAGAAIQATTTGLGPALSVLALAPSADHTAPPAAVIGDNGTGIGGGLLIDLSNSPNDSNALVVNTAGGGYAIYANCTLSTNNVAVIAAMHEGLGPGMQITLGSGFNESPALVITVAGSGPSIQSTDGPTSLGGGISANITHDLNYSPPVTATTAGRGPAVRGIVDNPTSGGPAFEGAVNGVGPAIHGTTSGPGSAVLGEIASPANESPALSGVTAGTGSGVAGEAANAEASGVRGIGTRGATGVGGTSDSGVGVYAESKTGPALDVVGKVTFSRSGIVTVPARAKSVRVPLLGVSSDSMVFATLQQASSAAGVANVIPASSSFTINLSAAASSPVRVAWMVLD